MAQQIKKKFLSPEVINYFDDQINAVESDISSLQSSKADKSYTDSQDEAKLAEAKAYTDSQISAIPPVDLSSYETIANVDSKDAAKLVEAKAYTDAQIAAIPPVDLSSFETIANVDSKDAAKLIEAKAYTDAQIAAIPSVDLSGYYTKTEVDGKESGLQSQIDTEKGRIDAILSASEADKDSFAEIVSLINSVDTTNDQAFAGYVLSNDAAVSSLQSSVSSLNSDFSDLEVYAQDVRTDLDAEISNRTSAVSALDTRVTALENAVDGPAFSNGSSVVGAELGFLELDKQYIKLMSVAVGRMAVHEGEDFTVSVVGGKTRLTWINSLANPSGEEKIETGDKVFWVGAY